MKKALAMVLTAVMSMSLMTGCGSSQTEEASGTAQTEGGTAETAAETGNSEQSENGEAMVL